MFKSKTGVFTMKIVSALIILLTFAIFFSVTYYRYTTHWMGLMFLISSEIMFFYGSPFIKQLKLKNTLLISGTTTVLAVYLVLALLLAFTSGLFINAVMIYTILQLTFFFVTIILTLILYAFSHKINKDIEKLLAEREEQIWESARGEF